MILHRVGQGLLAGGAMAALIGIVGPVGAQNAAGDAASGRRLAQQWCAECHGLSPAQPAGPNFAAPTFPALAGDPAVTPARIRAIFRAPHRSMPSTALSDSQIEDVVRFIASLNGR